MTTPVYWALVSLDDGGTIDGYHDEASAIAGFREAIRDGAGPDDLILLPYGPDGQGDHAALTYEDVQRR